MMVKPYKIGGGKKSKKTRAIEQEKEWAKELGATVSPNSGSTKFGAGDVIFKQDYKVFDNKYTKYKSYSIKKKTWNKIRKEALLETGMCEPALQVQIDADSDKPLDLVIIEAETYKEMVSNLNKLKQRILELEGEMNEECSCN